MAYQKMKPPVGVVTGTANGRIYSVDWQGFAQVADADVSAMTGKGWSVVVDQAPGVPDPVVTAKVDPVTGGIGLSASGKPLNARDFDARRAGGLRYPVQIAHGGSGWVSDNATAAVSEAGQEMRNPDNPNITYRYCKVVPSTASARVVLLNLPGFEIYDSITFAVHVTDFGGGAVMSCAVSSDNFTTKAANSHFWVDTQFRPNGLIFLTVGKGANGDRTNGEWGAQAWQFVGGQAITDKMNALRIQINSASGKEIRVLGVWTGKLSDRGNIILGFDDLLISQYTIGYDTCRRYGVPMTIALPQNVIGQSGHASYSQAREMYDSGLVDFVGHSSSHINLTSVPIAQAVDEVQKNRQYLLSHFPRGANCMVYTENAYNPDVLAMCRRSGFRFARSLNTHYIRASMLGIDSAMSLGGQTLSSCPLAEAKAYVDSSFKTGQTVWIYGHLVLDQDNPSGTGGTPPATGTHWYRDDWEALVEYIAEKRADGMANPVLWSQFEDSILGVPAYSVI